VRRNPPLALLLAALCGACAHEPPAPDARLIDVPAPPGSRFPRPALGPDGTLYLSWIEGGDAAPPALRLAAFDGRTWSEPREVLTARELVVNWADFPTVLPLAPERLAAALLLRHGPGATTYDAWILGSSDGGRSWPARTRAHLDATATEHGFVSLFAAPGGGLEAIWLDGRNIEIGTDEASATMQLMHRRLGPAPGPETVLDPDVCTCCQTAAAVDGDDVYVAYRDHAPGSLRDISLVRRTAGAWSAPRPVHEDRWHIAGCPVNGPAVQARDGRAAVAWFTAAGEEPRALVAFSPDRGERFDPPQRVDSGGCLGRVDLLLDESGAAWVSWVERGKDGAAGVRLRRIAADGTASPARWIGPADAGRPSGFPRMARDGGTIYVAWTASGPPARVVVAVVTP